uniref:MARVEL domain-containing protein n=1 Tax=Romanomermis culicivorax TaxID=13658 RepID=A0A915L0H2_ROMCU
MSSNAPPPVTTTTAFSSTPMGTVVNDENRYKIWDGCMTVSSASTVIALSHVLIFFVIFMCQFAALRDGQVGGFLTILTFISFIFLIWSLISIVGLCAAFANENPNWILPLFYMVIFSIFYFTIMACLTIGAMAVEGPSMEFMRAMYSNTPNYSDALIRKYSSFKVFLREVTSPRLAIFLFVHIFAMVFDCAAFGICCATFQADSKILRSKSDHVALYKKQTMRTRLVTCVQIRSRS